MALSMKKRTTPARCLAKQFDCETSLECDFSDSECITPPRSHQFQSNGASPALERSLSPGRCLIMEGSVQRMLSRDSGVASLDWEMTSCDSLLDDLGKPSLSPPRRRLARGITDLGNREVRKRPAEDVQGRARKMIRSHSAAEDTIMSALQKVAPDCHDLIGDMTQAHCLPLVAAVRDYPEVKSISIDTMADMLFSRYERVISDYVIIDCRFPYEFDGGHIRGAVNLFTRDMLTEVLFANPHYPSSESRRVLFFHCEYSSERGPQLYKFLRSFDRYLNSDNYPMLFYPEMYLISGGYRAFFAKHKELCAPQAYRSMFDIRFREDYRRFKGFWKQSREANNFNLSAGVGQGQSRHSSEQC